MPSEESEQRSKEWRQRRRKALRLGMKKLKRQEERRAIKEEEEVQRRPYNSFEATEIVKRKGRDEDPYDLESLFTQE